MSERAHPLKKLIAGRGYHWKTGPMPDGMQSEDMRWLQRFANFKRAHANLARALALAKERPLTELEEQGLVQAFEFTHELAWNVMRDFLRARGVMTNMTGSKDATREAFSAGLMENGEAWMEMIKHRNLTSHTYDEGVAEEIVQAILKSYSHEFEKFLKTYSQFEKEDRK